MTVLWVVLAGALGAAARYVIDWMVSARTPRGWPWATLTVNVVGSLIGGVVAGMVIVAGVADGARLVVGVGFAGSFTTFSTFAVDTVALAAGGDRTVALANVAATLAASLAAAAAGLAAGAALV